MLDVKFIRQHKNVVEETLKKRQVKVDIEGVINLDQKRIELIKKTEALRHERKRLSKEDKPENRKRGKDIKDELKKYQPELKIVEKKLHQELWNLPNLVSDKAPVGKDESDNKVLRTWGKKPKFDFKAKDHLELGKMLDIIDFAKGAKVTGSQFYFLKNEAVILEFALVRFALDFLIKEGFTPWITPDLSKSRYYLGTGYLPKGPEAQIYTIEGHNLGLVATSEITLAGIHADEILNHQHLPKKYLGYSHCYRVEAGGYGKYSKGLYRVHQFTKVEMFIYCQPEESDNMHQYLLSLEEKIYQTLNIPYRVLEMCTADLGNQAARKFDLEAWMPGRNDYGEITSTSNCTDYQARRLNVRVRRKDGSIEHPHMLNGTAIATPRAIIAILENFQTKDGTVVIPKPLISYMGKEVIA